jgi:hypothetical protein
MKHYLQS